METNVKTPVQIFSLPQHLVVPLFQRPYVWDETDQWAPLWSDIRRLTELRLRDPYTQATHFLGAVVVQVQDGQLGTMAASNIIDGQQRMTTLQLLMAATSALLESAGQEALAGQLGSLTHNHETFVPAGDSRLKIRHTNRDKAAFDEVMGAPRPVAHSGLKAAESKVVRAHAFFTDSVRGWLGDPAAPECATRANALVGVLTAGLQLVTINLTALENSQEIFETLNARGTPLTAADLIKNFVFQRLAAEGADTHHAYAEHWPFDTKFWETTVSVGRYKVSRGSQFLNQWLIARLGEEVGPQQTFTRFKAFVEHEAGQKMIDLLPTIKAQASLYEAWTEASEDKYKQLTPVEMSVYRMRVNEVEIAKSILIWLHDPEWPVPSSEIEKVVAAVESWLVRRMFLRLTASDLGRIIADIIRIHRRVDPCDLGDQVTHYLSGLNANSNYWPGDDEVREELTTEPSYRRFKVGRLRVFLEAIENDFRSRYNQGQVPRVGYPIEHVIPQKWQDNWPVDGLTAEVDRVAHVHRLGNLTLLTSSLNSKVSNGSWVDKREALVANDTLLLNSRLLLEAGDETWAEPLIEKRGGSLADALMRIWPVPVGHTGDVIDPRDKGQNWVEIRDLVAAGLLQPGDRLTPRSGDWDPIDAVILEDGTLDVAGEIFTAPSTAAQRVKGAVTNGWTFWSLADGRRIADVRAAFRGEKPLEDVPWTQADVDRLSAEAGDVIRIVLDQLSAEPGREWRNADFAEAGLADRAFGSVGALTMKVRGPFKRTNSPIIFRKTDDDLYWSVSAEFAAMWRAARGL